MYLPSDLIIPKKEKHNLRNWAAGCSFQFPLRANGDATATATAFRVLYFPFPYVTPKFICWKLAFFNDFAVALPPFGDVPPSRNG